MPGQAHDSNAHRLSVAPMMDWIDEYSMSQDPLGREPPFEIDRAVFCAALTSARPSNCSASTPPSTPLFDPNWQGNGCGTDSFLTPLLQSVAGVNVDDYTGDLNNPLPGVSFVGACNTHDRCYGLGGSLASCDTQFANDLQSICNGSGSMQSQCNTLRSRYVWAVGVGGEGAHADAQAEARCAAWHHDMEANECEE